MTTKSRKRALRIFDSPNSSTPEVQLLSNGTYHVMVTSAGGGYSRWNSLTLIRWVEDAVCDNWGSFCYVRDVASREYWSIAYQPTLKRADVYESVFPDGSAVFRRRDLDIETYTEIIVASEDDVEVRRTCITNHSGARRMVEITSYAEIVLTSPAIDSTHLAILCCRRPRSG